MFRTPSAPHRLSPFRILQGVPFEGQLQEVLSAPRTRGPRGAEPHARGPAQRTCPGAWVLGVTWRARGQHAQERGVRRDRREKSGSARCACACAPPAPLRPPRPLPVSASAAVNKVLARRKRKRRVSMAAATAAAAGPVLWRRLLGLLPGRPGLAALLGRLSDRLGSYRDRRRRR